MDKEIQPLENRILDYIRVVKATNYSGIARKFGLHHSGINDIVRSLERRKLVRIIETKERKGVKIVIPMEEKRCACQPT